MEYNWSYNHVCIYMTNMSTNVQFLKKTFIQVSIDVYFNFFFLNVVGYLNIAYTKNKLIDVLT